DYLAARLAAAFFTAFLAGAFLAAAFFAAVFFLAAVFFTAVFFTAALAGAFLAASAGAAALLAVFFATRPKRPLPRAGAAASSSRHSSSVRVFGSRSLGILAFLALSVM